MFKEIFTRLIRHLPSRLVHRDPLPGAQQTVNTAVPPSLSAHCLKMAVMPEEELWKTFDTHPEGLNQAEVESAREQHGENKLPAQQPSPWGYIYGSAIATPLIFYSPFSALFLTPRKIYLPRALLR